MCGAAPSGVRQEPAQHEPPSVESLQMVRRVGGSAFGAGHLFLAQLEEHVAVLNLVGSQPTATMVMSSPLSGW